MILSEKSATFRDHALRHDENIFAPPHHFVFAQLELAVADAFAGRKLVFVAVPWAHEMHLIAERLALIGAVGGDEINHPVDEQPFAGRPARLQAVVAVRMEGSKRVNYRIRSEAVVNRNSLQASYLEMSFYLATPSSILSHALRRPRSCAAVSKDGRGHDLACGRPSRRAQARSSGRGRWMKSICQPINAAQATPRPRSRSGRNENPGY